MTQLDITNLKVSNVEATASFDYAGDSYFYNLNFQELSVMENGEAILNDSEDNLNLSVELDQDWGNEKTHAKLYNSDGYFNFSFGCAV